MIIMRGIALLFLLIGGALLALGLGGFADDWINGNVSCGDSYSSRPCEPGEAQAIMTLVGGIFAGVSLLLLVASVWLGRAMRPLTALAAPAVQQWPLTTAVAVPGATAPTAPMPSAAGAERSWTASPGSRTCATAASSRRPSSRPRRRSCSSR